MLTPVWSEAVNLRDWIRQRGKTHKAFGQTIRCVQQAVSKYCDGRVPAPAVMRRIIEETGGEVQPNDFFGLPGADPTAVLEALRRREDAARQEGAAGESGQEEIAA